MTTWADFQAGVDAYNRGDFTEAYKQWLPLAEQGHAYAQNNLGLMYAQGEGVPQDYGEAVRWFRQAAEQGYADAQLNLGLMYDNGEGVPQDYVRAYAWLNLAAAQGHAQAVKNRDIVRGWMTASQVAEAQQLTRTLAAEMERDD